jgi:hypothetical protein
VAKRGFHVRSPEAVKLLETIGHSFLGGFEHAVGAGSLDETTTRLEAVPYRFRGFAYEGAAMGLSVLRGLAMDRRNRLDGFLRGPGDPHIYMAYVGVGWACARLPRWRWRAVLPNDPLLGWLVLDGYGFHQAYFHTRRYVTERFQDPGRGWPYPGADKYATRAIDQGIGRALWFVCGTDVSRVAQTIGGFPEHRHEDLWSGAGLAATYAGGVDEADLRRFRELSGTHRAAVAQGSAFAAEARLRAGLVTEHTPVATGVLCGMSPEEAAALSREVRSGLPESASEPIYEIWRQRLARQFVSHWRC